MRPAGPLRILVTGATGGIGQRVAENLARQGHQVWATGRDPVKGRNLETAWQAQGLDIRFLAADFSDQAGTLDFARRVLAEPQALDVLINNVGGVWPRKELTPEGLEKTLAVNHVHSFILSEALFPKLSASQGKVIHMSTGYQFLVTLGPEDWHQRRWDSGMNVYGRSKKISILAGLSLCQRWADCGVVVQFADPGMAWTPLTATMGPEYFPAYGRFLVPGIQALQRQIPLDWAASSAVTLAEAFWDQRPGVYCLPGGLRWPVWLTPADRRLGQKLLRMTLEDWVTPATREFLKGVFSCS